MKRRVLMAAGVVALVAGVSALVRAKRLADQRGAALAACLLGEPLAPGEAASDRMLRLDLGEPWLPIAELMKENSKKTARWPASCQAAATTAASSFYMGMSERKALKTLAEALGGDDLDAQQSAADDVSLLGASRELPKSNAVTWKPVAMLKREAGTTQCDDYGSMGHGDVALYAGRASALGCAVEARGAERLASLRPRRESDKREASGRRSCAVGGPPVSVVLTPDGFDARATTQSFVVTFGEDAPLTASVSSRFVQGRTSPVEASAWQMTCRGNEVHIAWSWAAIHDARADEELVVISCVPGRCETKITNAHVETIRHSNCGYCRPTDDELQLVPPTVIDLFGDVALVWSDHRSLRARIGPIDRLDGSVDQVLAYAPTGLRAHAPNFLIGGDVALVSVTMAPEPAPREATHFFRLVTGSPARELLMP